MNKAASKTPPTFGEVDFESEHGLFFIDTARGRACRLTLVGRTERGYPRREVAFIPGALWKEIGISVQNELIRGLESDEKGDAPTKFHPGDNALSPLVVRELAVLLWAIMEDGEGTHIDALVAGWRQLAREERWWLYARASSPAQQLGQGWRRALFFALTDPADTRTAPRLLDLVEAASGSKKNSGAKPTGSNGTHRRPPSPKNKRVPKSTKRSPIREAHAAIVPAPTTKLATKNEATRAKKKKPQRVTASQTVQSLTKAAAPKKTARKKTATTTVPE
jgi:hypothetical protein